MARLEMSKQKLVIRKRGFTLLELLIGMTIVVVIMAVLAVAFRDAYVSLTVARHRQALLDETRRSVDTVTDLVTGATAVVASYTSTEPQTYQATATSLVLQIPAYDMSGGALANAFDTVVVMPEPTESSILTIRTFPATGSRRAAGVKRLTMQLEQFAVRYFEPDRDGDLADEELTDPALYATATRVAATVATELVLPDQTLDMRLVGGGRLRN